MARALLPTFRRVCGSPGEGPTLRWRNPGSPPHCLPILRAPREAYPWVTQLRTVVAQLSSARPAQPPAR